MRNRKQVAGTNDPVVIILTTEKSYEALFAAKKSFCYLPYLKSICMNNKEENQPYQNITVSELRHLIHAMSLLQQLLDLEKRVPERTKPENHGEGPVVAFP
jgi:hypothetical protein